MEMEVVERVRVLLKEWQLRYDPPDTPDDLATMEGFDALVTDVATLLATVQSERETVLHRAASKFLTATEALCDWLNATDISADHEAERPDDYERVNKTMVALRAALATPPGVAGKLSLTDTGKAILKEPAIAVIIARWILDTFEDAPRA